MPHKSGFAPRRASQEILIAQLEAFRFRLAPDLPALLAGAKLPR